MPSAEKRTETPGTQEVVVEQLGRLQKVINEAGVETTGVARGVRLIRAGKDLTPKLGIGLHEGDRIVTDGGTRAIIGSETGPEISLGPNSDLTLRKGSGFLSLGSLLVSVKRLFRLETKFVVAGVEGTEFSLSVDSGDVTALSVLEGSVRVESRVGRWAPRSYKEGEQCVARGEAEPEKRPLDGETRKQLLRWVVDLERPVPGASGTAWEITRSERAVSTGRIVVHVPATADVKVVVFKDGAEVGYWFGDGSKSLFPGNYDVTVSGAPVASVPVQKGMDTRIRAGVFKIKVDGGWELYDESGTRELYYAFNDKSVGLPVGTYKLKIAGIFGPVTIRDNETTEF